MPNKPETILFLNDARGIYIPQAFASFIKRECVSGVSPDGWYVLNQGPDHEDYWNYWEDVLNDAVVTDDKGVRYTLHQDGDLWLVPVGMEWNEESDSFEWPAHEHD